MTNSDKPIKKKKQKSLKKIKKAKKKKSKATISATEILEVKKGSIDSKSVKQQDIPVTTTEKQETSNKGRPYTVSIALPGSILDNAQSPELRTYLAGQIARHAVIFNIDEIVVFDESGKDDNIKETDGNFSGVGHSSHKNKAHCCLQLARLLQYLECPQYLRKDFFPRHNDLSMAGLMNPLDSPHHMRALDKSKYREGVVLDRPTKSNKGLFNNYYLFIRFIFINFVVIELPIILSIVVLDRPTKSNMGFIY